jgi:SAM-dependent methyltransferase
VFRILVRTFPRLGLFALVSELRRLTRGCKTCLEVGCGGDSPARLLSFDRYAGVDAYAPAILEAQQRDPKGEYYVGRAEHLDFPDKAFDCVIALDLIEHLTKEDGFRFLEECKRVARKRVILFTPNGFLPQKSKDGDMNEHLSGWEAGEMRTLGFNVRGKLGPKVLRGEHHSILRRPRQLWTVISHFCQLFTPAEKAAAILCVLDTAPKLSTNR